MESLCCYFRRELNRRIQDDFDGDAANLLI